MPNQLKMPKIQSILKLREQGWSLSRIAETLGIHRQTVARYVRVESKPSEAPPGSSDSKSPQAHSELAEVGRSPCDPFRQVILAKLDQGLHCKRIHQDLVEEHQFQGSYWSVMRFARRWKQVRQLPFRRIEREAGEEAQVDFGTGAPVISPDGRRRKTHVFRIILSHSRKGYSEAVFQQSTESFIGALENAFWHFGGTVKTLVIDNLRAAVTKADWYEPELHPRLQEFCDYYGVVILPTRPYMPRHKGKVESGVKYVKNNGLKGRHFECIEAENDFLLHWEATVADTRIHGTTQRQVRKAFEEVERQALGVLPLERFPFFREAQRRVNRDGHVEVQRRYYSAPPEYVGRSVWVRWDRNLVRIFNRRLDEIRVHVISHTEGTFTTHPADIAPEKISGIERDTKWFLERASRIGPHADQWAQDVIHSRGIQGIRSVMGLISLTKNEKRDDIDKACEIALSYGAYRLRHIRQLLKRQAPKQEFLEFTQEHPIIRGMDVYGDLVRTAFRKPVIDRIP